MTAITTTSIWLVPRIRLSLDLGNGTTQQLPNIEHGTGVARLQIHEDNRLAEQPSGHNVAIDDDLGKAWVTYFAPRVRRGSFKSEPQT